MFLPLFYYFEILAFITSAVFLFKANNRSLRWFPFFLFFIVAVEFTAMYIRQVLHQPNVWLYNFSIPVEYLFFGLIFFCQPAIAFKPLSCPLVSDIICGICDFQHCVHSGAGKI